MIDCENEVYTRIATPLRSVYNGIDISSTSDNVPAAFPHVTIEMTDNKTVDCADGHERAEVSFTVNIFSNAVPGKKTEVKKIAGTIDELFRTIMNAKRMVLHRTPNENDPSVYRMTAIYQFITDGIKFYRS